MKYTYVDHTLYILVQEVANEEDFDQEQSINAIRKLVDDLNVGKTVREVVSNTAPEDIQNLQCIESQMAIISVIEKLGFQKLSEEIIFEQLQSERVGLFNIIGSKAMVKLIDHTTLTADEILAYFDADDFKAETVQQKVADILDIALQVNMAQVQAAPSHTSLTTS